MHNSRGSRFLTVVGAPTGCTEAGGRRPLVSARKLHRPLFLRPRSSPTCNRSA